MRTTNEKLASLTKTKRELTDQKIAKWGYFDNDDHGSIYYEGEIPFKLEANHTDGHAYGARAIGANMLKLLSVYPLYIHPDSALAGAWFGSISQYGFGGWAPEDRPFHFAALHKKYNIRAPGIGAMNHAGPDMRIGLELGWGGLLKKIARYKFLNNNRNSDFYDGEADLVRGVQILIERHAKEAQEKASKETDTEYAKNYQEIADMNFWLINQAPRTFREACQFLAWFQTIDRMYFMGGALSQLDTLLFPYYVQDKHNGIINDEEVIWYLASLFYNDTHYSQVGGPGADGLDQTNELSFLILEAVHRLKIPYNIAVRVHEGLDKRLLRKAVELIFEDGSGPDFSCNTGIAGGFQRNGVHPNLANMRAKVGCNWCALPGVEYCLQDVTRLCLVAPFVLAFNEMLDSNSEKNLDELWKRYIAHMKIAVKLIKDGIDWHMKYHAKNAPEMVLNLFSHGPIERGLDMAEGGVDINYLNCDGVGLATVADSFAAIEQRVCKENRITWSALKEVMDNNWQDAENVRLMMKNINRFGSGGSPADNWAKKISELYTNLMRGTATDDNYIVLPGLFSHGTIRWLGENLPATPNGRFIGEAISHSSEPDPGFAKDWGASMTAKANAVAFVQPGYGNSAPLHLDIDKNLAMSSGGIDNIMAIINTHDRQGGTLINMNIVTKEQLLAADKEPEKFPDLVVRVTGYSGYFRSLSPMYRKQVLERFLAE